jgi:hypothetical protein
MMRPLTEFLSSLADIFLNGRKPVKPRGRNFRQVLQQPPSTPVNIAQRDG